MRVKFFMRGGYMGSYKPEHHHELGDEVNTWLERNPSIKVKDIKQSSSGGSWVKPQLFIVILYEPAD